MRLSNSTAANLPPEVARFRYERGQQRIGIVHFGIGAFHRAHQAWYADCAMNAGERDWAICGVSLRSSDVSEQLQPQDGLYTITTGAGEATRLIGAVREVLQGSVDADAIIARIADPACRIVSFTVTEKGYCRKADGALDHSRVALSFYPLLARGLAARMASGAGGVTLLCCDNLAANGRVLADLFGQYCTTHDPDLADWFTNECRVPSTMVDRIVPRADLARREALADKMGVVDQGAVFTEGFCQWVIEDDFAGPRPGWDAHGVQFVSDVAPFETAKLRMLNGAHSLIAYAGLRAGHGFVHEAMADPALRNMADQLMRVEALPGVPETQGLDLTAYADVLLERFADPALGHRLAQIAMDGTQKIPQRWLDTALACQEAGKDCPAIVAAFDAWLWHLADARFVDDPLGPELTSLMANRGRGAVIARCFTDPAPLWPGYASLADLFHTLQAPPVTRAPWPQSQPR